MTALALSLIAPASAQASEKRCRYTPLWRYTAPVVGKLRISVADSASGGEFSWCQHAGFTADNLVTHWNEHGHRLPQRPEGSGFVCHYRGGPYRVRARCKFAGVVVRMRLHLP